MTQLATKTPAMQSLADQVRNATSDLAPFISVTTNDRFGSSVSIKGSFTPREDWSGGIYYNGMYFMLVITCAGNETIYDESQSKVTIERLTIHPNVNRPTFRKYTGPIEKCIEKLVKWIEGTYR